MFPANQFRDTITLFTPYTDKDTRLTRMYRRVLHKVFQVSEVKVENRAGANAAPGETRTIIPAKHNKGYVSRDTWSAAPAAELDRLWSIRIDGDNSFCSMIMQGDFLYPELEEWRILEDYERAIAVLTSDNHERIRYPAHVSEMLYGPESMRRIVTWC